MQMMSLDRRSLRTRAALKEALAEELQNCDLSQVTVTALTQRADVTRRTFYSHYRDISDLVEDIEGEVLAEMQKLLSVISETRLDELSAAIEAYEPCPGSIELLSYLRDNGELLRPLLGEHGDPAFAEKIKRMAHETVATRALDGIDARALGSFFDYYLSFVIGAEVGVLMRWLASGMQESVASMARIMTTLMFVRPGDLYGRSIDLDIPGFVTAVLFAELEAADEH